MLHPDSTQRQYFGVAVAPLYRNTNTTHNQSELGVKRPMDRIKIALEAIEMSSGTDEGEYGIDGFVSHHLEELPAEFWEKHLNTAIPSTGQIISILVLRSKWGDGKIYDFALPDEVTNYVVCVRFDDQGVVDNVSMES